jgi:S1-C subfamily serine protease
MIGFAIPSNMVRPIAQSLIKDGKVRRPYLGIVMQDVTPQLAGSLGPGAPSSGAIVNNVQEGSPAQKAGVAAGDVIVKVDGQAVDGSKAVQKAVLTHNIGQKLNVDVWRNGKPAQLVATLAEFTDGEGQGGAGGGGAEDGKGRLGIELQNLTPELAQRLGVREKSGAVVAGVQPDGPAAEAGVQEGDVIVEIDRQKVSSAEDASKLLKATRSGGHLLRLRRGDGAFYVVVGGS